MKNIRVLNTNAGGDTRTMKTLPGRLDTDILSVLREGLLSYSFINFIFYLSVSFLLICFVLCFSVSCTA